MRYRRNTEETNFWAGYADCMLALFMIALVLWILSAGITAFTDSKMAGVVDKNERLIAENEKLKAENEALRKELEDESDWYAKFKEKEKDLAEAIKDIEQLQRDKKALELEIDNIEKLQPKIKAIESKLGLASDWYETYRLAIKPDTAEKDALELEMAKLESKMKEIGIPETEVIDNLVNYVGLLVSDIETAKKQIGVLEKEKQRLIAENEKVLVEIAGTGETFESGNAVINKDFREKLEGFDGPFAKLADNIKKRNGKVVLEIIGHTDGQPLSSEGGNLDTKLPHYLTDIDYNVKNLKAGSNNDLGLLRALAISKAWIAYIKEHSYNDELSSVKIHCYSAGQTVPPRGGDLKSPEAYLRKNAAARRIEMRLRNTNN